MDRLLQDAQVAALEELAANGPTEHVRRRARILLMYHAGKTTREIAETVGLTTGRVAYWRREFLKRGMDIFPSAGEASPAPASQTTLSDTEAPKAMKTPSPEAKAVKTKKAAKAKKAAKPKAAKAKKAAKPKAAKTKKAAKPKVAPLTGGLLRKAEKVVTGVAGVLGKKAIKRLDAITSQENFQEFVAYVRKQRKKLLKKLDAKGLKKKQIKFLRSQLKELEAQIAKAEKLLQKLED
jgi:hypothetical protein